MISFKNDPNELKGRRALVTGGSRGIGGAIVRCLLSVGAGVVAVARNPVEDFPADAAWIQGNVAAWKACSRSSNRRLRFWRRGHFGE
jgi:NAD(P)-dependent dehydrogenase (short-subunit alcohol dehydrogenase family)